MNGIRGFARIKAVQDVELALKNLKMKMIGQPRDESLLTWDR